MRPAPGEPAGPVRAVIRRRSDRPSASSPRTIRTCRALGALERLELVVAVVLLLVRASQRPK